jgi:hypothetical protein
VPSRDEAHSPGGDERISRSEIGELALAMNLSGLGLPRKCRLGGEGVRNARRRGGEQEGRGRGEVGAEIG